MKRGRKRREIPCPGDVPRSMQMYWVRRNAGLCVDCGRFAESRRVRCSRCAKRLTAYTAAYSRKRRDARNPKVRINLIKFFAMISTPVKAKRQRELVAALDMTRALITPRRATVTL